MQLLDRRLEIYDAFRGPAKSKKVWSRAESEHYLGTLKVADAQIANQSYFFSSAPTQLRNRDIMSQLPTLPQEILDEIIRTAIDLIIRTARVQIYNSRCFPEEVSRAAEQILSLRFLSRASAREVMSICWKRLDKILSNADPERKISPAAGVEERILERCVSGWIEKCQDDDHLLARARGVVRTIPTKFIVLRRRYLKQGTPGSPDFRRLVYITFKTV